MDTEQLGLEGSEAIQENTEPVSNSFRKYPGDSDAVACPALETDAGLDAVEDRLSDNETEEAGELEDSADYQDLADSEDAPEDTSCDTEGLADEPETMDPAPDEEDYASLADETLNESGANSEDLSEEEKAEIMKSFADQNVSPFVLPKSNGHWEGEEGNSRWIPDDDASVAWRKGGEFHSESYRAILDKYGIDGIEYFNKEPDFSEFEDDFIQHAELDHFSDDRTGSNGTYTLAAQATAERLGRETGEEWTPQRVQEYMRDHGLTWHECADRKTVRAIPTELNAGFKHTGGIGMEKSVSAAARALDEQYAIGEGFTLARESPLSHGETSKQELEQAIQERKKIFQKAKHT